MINLSKIDLDALPTFISASNGHNNNNLNHNVTNYKGLGLTLSDEGWIEIDERQQQQQQQQQQPKNLRFKSSSFTNIKNDTQTRIIGSSLLPLTPDPSPQINFNTFGRIGETL